MICLAPSFIQHWQQEGQEGNAIKRQPLPDPYAIPCDAPKRPLKKRQPTSTETLITIKRIMPGGRSKCVSSVRSKNYHDGSSIYKKKTSSWVLAISSDEEDEGEIAYEGGFYNNKRRVKLLLWKKRVKFMQPLPMKMTMVAKKEVRWLK